MRPHSQPIDDMIVVCCGRGGVDFVVDGRRRWRAWAMVGYLLNTRLDVPDTDQNSRSVPGRYPNTYLKQREKQGT